MAYDSLRERAADVLAHVCTLTALLYAARAIRVGDGWTTLPVVDTPGEAPSLSIVVPARNEEATIERCVRSLLTQTLPDVEVIVVDDRSSDRTGAILAQLAAEFPALRVVRGAALPPGWIGKPWALAQGARVARGAWLLFTDADTWHAPQACASALALARDRQVDAVTLWTYQELRSWSERAILPVILGMVLLGSGTMRELNDPHDAEHALANGQYILVTREAYDALGGHEALRGEILDDVTFAHRLKSDGRFRLFLADGSRLVRVRMYTSLGTLWEGFTKNMYLGARGDLRVLGVAALFLAALSVLPAAVAVDGIVRKKPFRALEGTLCLASGVAVAALGFRRASIAPGLAWFAPFGYAACAAIMLDSTLRVRSGRGVTWRGRRYSGLPERTGL